MNKRREICQTIDTLTGERMVTKTTPADLVVAGIPVPPEMARRKSVLLLRHTPRNRKTPIYILEVRGLQLRLDPQGRWSPKNVPPHRLPSRDKQVFERCIDAPPDEVLQVFAKLCDEQGCGPQERRNEQVRVRYAAGKPLSYAAANGPISKWDRLNWWQHQPKRERRKVMEWLFDQFNMPRM